MPTYTYETIPSASADAPRRFDVRQRMSDPPLTHDPDTGLPVKRVFAAGYGVVTARGADAGGPAPAGPACGLGSGCGCAM
jgi:predicted nucleic acid-binding Zn ribbon protein